MTITADRVAAIVAEIRKTPFIALYGGDWVKDPISGCSLAAQGLWLRMMIAMHDARLYGHLTDGSGAPLDDRAIARQCGADSVTIYRRLVAELDKAGAPSRSGDEGYETLFIASINDEPVDLSPLRTTQPGVIYSRRMVKDLRLKVLRRLAGAKSQILVDQIPDQTPRARVDTRADTDTDSVSPDQVTKSPEGVQGEGSPVLLPDWSATERLMHKLEHCGLHPRGLPTPQIVAAWVGDYGEALIAETITDPRLAAQFAGKGWQYLERVIQTRKENPDERSDRPSGGRRAARGERAPQADPLAGRPKFKTLTADDLLGRAKAVVPPVQDATGR